MYSLTFPSPASAVRRLLDDLTGLILRDEEEEEGDSYAWSPAPVAPKKTKGAKKKPAASDSKEKPSRE